MYRQQKFFQSKTNLNSQRRQHLREILSVLLQHHLSVDFRQPVDYEQLGLTDYPEIVKYPMDLGTVCAKLKRKAYKSMEECLSDILQIWVNCKLYNPANHWLHRNAAKLDRFTRQLIRNYVHEAKFAKEKTEAQQGGRLTGILHTPGPHSAQQSYPISSRMEQQQFQEECERLLEALKKYSYRQVTILFLLVQRHCPSAIATDPSGNATIHLRDLSRSTIQLLFAQMQSWEPQPWQLVIVD